MSLDFKAGTISAEDDFPVQVWAGSQLNSALSGAALDIVEAGMILDPAWLPPHISPVLVGSAAIFGKGKDIDLAFSTKEPQALAQVLEQHLDWVRGSTGQTEWEALRKGNANLLLCEPDYYAGLLTACDVCKLLAKLGKLAYDEKDTRVAIHGVIMDGDPP